MRNFIVVERHELGNKSVSVCVPQIACRLAEFGSVDITVSECFRVGELLGLEVIGKGRVFQLHALTAQP